MIIPLACDNYGKEINVNNLQLFYKEPVKEDEAKSLANYITGMPGFAESAKDKIVTGQLLKEGDTYQYKMIPPEGKIDDKEYQDTLALAGALFSKELFNGAKVEIHLCNKTLDTQKVIKMGNLPDELENFESQTDPIIDAPTEPAKDSSTKDIDNKEILDKINDDDIESLEDIKDGTDDIKK